MAEESDQQDNEGEKKDSSGYLYWLGCILPLSIILMIILIGAFLFVAFANKLGAPLLIPKGLLGSSTLSNDCKKFNDNASQYLDTINRYASDFNVDPALVAAIIQQESGWNKNAVSKANAQGLMQLTQGTASDMGVSDPFDPEQNIMGGTKYISLMLSRFNGNTDLAIAAYNAGPGTIEDYGGIPPWTETQDYVKIVNANYQKYKECLKNNSGSGSANSNSSTENAKNILNNKNISFPFGQTDKYGDNESTAWQNIQDTANGQLASTSKRSHVGQKEVDLNPNMLAGLVNAANAGYNLQITYIAGGEHSPGSHHYNGDSVDMEKTGNFEELKKIMGAGLDSQEEDSHYHFTWSR